MYCVQDSLNFPDNVSTSGDVKDLIQGLLTEPSHRLAYDGIKSHPFFLTTNWDDLLSCKPQFKYHYCSLGFLSGMIKYVCSQVVDI